MGRINNGIFTGLGIGRASAAEGRRKNKSRGQHKHGKMVDHEADLQGGKETSRPWIASRKGEERKDKVVAMGAREW